MKNVMGLNMTLRNRFDSMDQHLEHVNFFICISVVENHFRLFLSDNCYSDKRAAGISDE